MKEKLSAICIEDTVDYAMKCNVEPQKRYDVGYPIEKRGMYYLAAG
ncbi:MAG: hypothetical protein HFG86_15580 [Dorea sp.]|nr:hypothetical protein [Dorea sp.]